MAANDDEGVLITRGSVRRIGRAVARVEGSPASGPGGPSGAAVYNPGVQRARVTTAIPTGTESSPSSTGAARLKVRDSAGAWVDGETVQVYNDFTMPASLPVGRMVRVAWIAGQWWLVSASCS
ncbi:MAG: hypothetical protein BGO49_08585 [Planctomycetales bacterium 71-10]|nr:MAG: hypothetical protein BGO49_08585 [Planctomycetales bacterium 71-10]